MMENKIVFYEYIIPRTKNKISQLTLKKQIKKEKENKCYICKKENRYLELEHKIPVMLGGNIINIKNLDLICASCHRKKTLVDKKIIKILKHYKVLNGKYIMHSMLNLKELKKFYLYFFPLIYKSTLQDKYEKFEKIIIKTNENLEL